MTRSEFDATAWPGRVDQADGPGARRWHQLVRPRGAGHAPLSLLGLACDAGVARNHGRIGAAEGPRALRQALASSAVHFAGPVDDLGDVGCAGDELEAAQAGYAQHAAAAIAGGSFVIGMGGGHEIAWASYCGLRDALEQAGETGPVGILNFDAHFDLRGDPRASSGTPFRQILDDAEARGRQVEYRCLGISRQSNTAALFARAAERGVTWVEDVEMRVDRFGTLEGQLRAFAARFRHLYLTVCMDVFPAAAAPGVSAPAALGVDPALVDRLVGVVAASDHLMIADIAELNPRFDQDGRTARLAARMAARIAETRLNRTQGGSHGQQERR